MCGAKTDDHSVMGRRLNRSQGLNPRKKIGIATTVVRCTNCKLIYSNPQPIPFDLQDHYGVPPESYWKEAYFTVNENYFINEIAILKKLLDFKPDMRSLDIGAGLGKAVVALGKAGFDSYGFEPSKPFYERAISMTGISSDKLKFGMMEDLEYPENNFDFITFGAVLEHLYDPSASIEKAMRWLKPNGIMHIEVPSANWLTNKIYNLIYKLQGLDYVGNISPMHEPFHLYEFSLDSFMAHAKQNKYSIAFYEYYVGQTFLPSFADFILKPYMRKTNTGLQLCVWLRKN